MPAAPGILPFGQGDQRLRRDVDRFRRGAIVPQGLGGVPILTIAAVEVAAQHAEGERGGAGKDVKKGLLLDRIALECGDVAPGDQQPAALVEAHPADAPPAISNQAAVPAGHAAYRSVREGPGQGPFHSTAIEAGGERGRHGVPEKLSAGADGGDEHGRRGQYVSTLGQADIRVVCARAVARRPRPRRRERLAPPAPAGPACARPARPSRRRSTRPARAGTGTCGRRRGTYFGSSRLLPK